MTAVYVTYKDLVVDEYRSSAQYGNWRLRREYDVLGVTIESKTHLVQECVNLAGAVIEGDEVWVLWYTYQTGDSFGCDRGQGEIVWVFHDETTARAALQACEARRNQHGFVFKDEVGEDIHIGNAACGYFERVEEFHLRSFIVGQEVNGVEW